MRLSLRRIQAIFATAIAVLALYPHLVSQVRWSDPGMPLDAGLPESPSPQIELTRVDGAARQLSSSQNQNNAQAASGSAAAAQSSSSPQSPAKQNGAEKSDHEKGEEELKEEEKQRVVGVVPSFNVSYRADAVSLTGTQKLRLAFRSAVDPAAFAAGLLVAGYHEALNDEAGFHWGLSGYARRAGAAYLDAADGTMLGNGILPAILHQEPRYLRLGHGAYTHRLLYAIAANVVCPHDKTHKSEPNYSNVLGNIAAGAISNLYYPASNSGFGLTISNGLIDTGEGTFGTVFEEFWPDLSRRYLHKDPTLGRDAKARILDAEERQARREQKERQRQKPNRKSDDSRK
jgi:hypothetical protein